MPTDAVDEPARRQLQQTFVRQARAEPDQISNVRDELTDWVRALQFPPELVTDLELATYEAMANVVTHAYPDQHPGPLTVTATRRPGAIVVTVSDNGRWHDGPARTDGGRGLLLIRALAPEASITSTLTGTTVEMTWPWKPA
ncbi:ATP-binding protein [Amycolatopsis thermoflava]|uniref:ATP-binding protein n=1 Tax=Amycolatopsis thermoflava TaxID=84480 RepID=UPI0036596DBA